MKNHFFLMLAVLCTNIALAADTVRFDTTIDLIVTGITDTSYELNSTEASGDSTAESAPTKVYVPIKSSVNADYFLLQKDNSPYSYTFDVTDTSDQIEFPLYLNIGSTDTYLYVAAKDGSSYKLAQSDGILLKNKTNSPYPYRISPNKICAQMTASQCNNFLPTGSVSDERAIVLYFFLSTSSSIADASPVDSTTYPGGIYVEVNMSNRVYPTLNISITNVRKGDKRAFIEYTASATILKPKNVRVYDRVASATRAPIGTVAGTLNSQEYTYAQNSEVAVTNLVNGQDYNLSLMFVDQYNFATQLSPTASATPMEIQELLKKEACFLITAGFGEEHYVISYFRHFRDAVLSKSFLGRAFINFYYDSAPKYALLIYKHETLRAMIRGVAYALYFIFNYIVPILILSFAFSVFIYLHKKREKIKI